jgi:hypothetical protein
MLDHLNHSNLQAPHASILFIQEGVRYQGVSLQLTKVSEKWSSERIKQPPEERSKSKFLNYPAFCLFFEIDKNMPYHLALASSQDHAGTLPTGETWSLF